MGQLKLTPRALQCAEIAGMSSFDLTAGVIIVLFLLHRLNLGYG